MRVFMCFLTACVFTSGIAAIAAMRELPVAIAILCALMYVVSACAFLLPVLSINWKGRIAGIVTVHFLAVCYLEFTSPWFAQRQIDEILSRVAEVEGRSGPDDILANEVRIASVHIDMLRKRALYPAYVLFILDLVWLVWLLVPTTTAGAITSDVSRNAKERTALTGVS